jgi:hypothetical protein
MDGMTVPCTYCGTPVDPTSRYVWARIQGWEKKALASSTRRGGSDISLREHLDEYACDGCIRKLKSGVSPGQSSLI